MFFELAIQIANARRCLDFSKNIDHVRHSGRSNGKGDGYPCRQAVPYRLTSETDAKVLDVHVIGGYFIKWTRTAPPLNEAGSGNLAPAVTYGLTAWIIKLETVGRETAAAKVTEIATDPHLARHLLKSKKGIVVRGYKRHDTALGAQGGYKYLRNQGEYGNKESRSYQQFNHRKTSARSARQLTTDS